MSKNYITDNQVIKFCSIKGIKLTLKHFDRDSNSFIDDVVFDKSF